MIIRHYLGIEEHEFIPKTQDEIEFLATVDKNAIEESLSTIIPQCLYKAQTGKTAEEIKG